MSITTIDRLGKDEAGRPLGNYLVECDCKGCKNCFDAMCVNFYEVPLLARDKGWGVRRNFNTWENLCPEHNPNKRLPSVAIKQSARSE
jgi:hypothetical protein